MYSMCIQTETCHLTGQGGEQVGKVMCCQPSNYVLNNDLQASE